MSFVSKNPKFNSTILSDVAAGAVDAPALGSHKLINRNGQIFIVDDTGAETEVGSAGSGEINYIKEWNAETAIANWATYKNAAQATPETGTGGSATLTFTRQDSVVLRGRESFKITKSAANLQGEGVSYDFSIKEQDVSKKLKIQFDFKTDEDAAYEAGDLTVYIYDVTNSTLITPVDTAIVRGQNIFQTSFNSTTSTSYRLIFHVADDSSNAWNAYIDNVIVGPGMTSQGAAIGPSESITLDSSHLVNGTNLTIDASNTNASISRRGDRAILVFRLDFNTSATGTDVGTFGLNVAQIMNDIYGISGFVFPEALYGPIGLFAVGGSTPNARVPGTYTSASSGVIQFSWESNLIAGTATGGATAGKFRIFAGSIDFKVSEWAGKGIVPMLAEDNLSEWQQYPDTLSGFGTPTNNLRYRRVGSALEFKGTVTSGIVSAPQSIGLPSGLTVSSASSSDEIVGTFDRTIAHQKRNLLAANGDTSMTFGGYDGSGVNPLTPDTANNICNNSELISIKGRVEIQEWQGSQNSLVGYSLASETQTGLVNAGTQTLGGEKTFADVTNFTSGIGDVGGTVVNNGRFGITTTSTLSTSTNYDTTVDKSGKSLDLIYYSVGVRVDNNNGTPINSNVSIQILDSNDNSVIHTSANNNVNLPTSFDDILYWSGSAILKKPVGDYIFRFVITTPGGGAVGYYYGFRNYSVSAIHLG